MKKKILVVDNSPVIVKLLSHILESDGHTVKTAENGLDALEKLQYFHPDIIFVDLIMPKIGGDIFCRIIRSRKEFHKVLLVVLSAVAAEGDFDYHSLGADAFIAKGPATEMKKHINFVIDNCNTGKYKLTNAGVLGIEGVHKREITTELLSTKHHFEITLEHMTDGFIEMTADSRIIYANSRATKFFKLPKEQLISSNFFSYFQNKMHHHLIESFAKMGSDSIELGEDEVITIHRTRVLLKFIPLEQQEQNSVIVLITDVTNRKQLEEQIKEDLMYLEENIALRTQEYLKSNKLLEEEISKRSIAHEQLSKIVKQLRVVFDIVPHLISVHDENMKFVMVNKAFGEAFGKTPEAIIGLHCYTLIHNSEGPPPNCPHRLQAQKHNVISEEVDDLVPGKSMSVTCAPCFNDNGSFIGTVHIAMETADRKKKVVEL